jgi:uncharacterized protein (UPF0332 family)
MTGENRERNAGADLERAETCLQEARHLQEADLPYGAASRAYYAVFHAARALLFSIGLEPTSHRGVVNMLGEHFVRPGLLAPELARLVSRMHADRHDADYFLQAVFTPAEGAKALTDAERFLEAVRRLLEQE